MVLAQDGKGFRTVMSSEELASFGGDANQFVSKLREKGALSSSNTQSSL